MALSIKEICVEALNEIGFDPPSQLASGDDLGRQLLAISNSCIRDVAKRLDWQELRLEGTFTSVDTELQVDLDVSFPHFRKILPETVWNRDRQEPLIGPLTPQAWQRIKADDMTPSFPTYYIRSRKIYFPGSPTPGENIYFEYMDKRAVASSNGSVLRERFEADTDVPRLDDHAMVLCVRWRFLQRKGLEYGEAFREYEDWVTLRQDESMPRETLNMNPRHSAYRGAAGEGDWLRGLTWNPDS